MRVRRALPAGRLDARNDTLIPGRILRQVQIVTELDSLHAQVDVLKRLQAETAAELDALLPSILDKALNGEL